MTLRSLLAGSFSATKQEFETAPPRKQCVVCGLRLSAEHELCPIDEIPLQSLAKDSTGEHLWDRYKFLGLIGTGGMGVIYKAQQPFLEKCVAIKMLHAHITAPAAQRRFLQEARALNSLSHPNIVCVHEFGITQGSRPFMVMEYFQGKTLNDLLSEQIGGCLSPAQAMPIFLQIAAALAHSHKNGILHRDIKPSNVILTIDAEGKTVVKVVDFGIAKFCKNPDSEKKLTATGTMLGSPMYMSPEQILGRSVDARSDLYSFGCLMYEVLTGAPPFEANCPLGVMTHHLYETVAPLKLDTANEQSWELELETLVLRLLSKDAACRYESTDKLMIDLLKVSRHEKISSLARPRADGQRAAKRINTLKTGFTSCGSRVQIVAFVIALTVFIGQLTVTHKPKDGHVNLCDSKVAAQAPRRAGKNISDEMIDSMRHLRNIGYALDVADHDLDNATDAGQIEHADGTDPFLDLSQGTGKLQNVEAEKRTSPHHTEQNWPLLRGKQRVLQALQKDNHLDINLKGGCALHDLDLRPLAETRLPIQTLRLNGNIHISDRGLQLINHLPLRILNLSKTAVRDLIALKHLDSLRQLQLRSTGLSSTGYAVVARLRLLDNLDLSETMITDRDLKQLRSLRKLANLQLIDCPKLSQQAIKSLQMALPACYIATRETETAKRLSKIASAALTEKDYTAAAKLYHQAEVLLPIGADLCVALQRECNCQIKLGNFDKAETFSNRAVSIAESLQHARISLPDVLLQNARVKQCQQRWQEAASICNKVLSMNMSERTKARALNQLGASLNAQKHFVEAIQVLSQAPQLEAEYSEDFAHTLSLMADAYAGQKNGRQAIWLYRCCLRKQLNILGDPESKALCLLKLGDSYFNNNEIERAASYWHEAESLYTDGHFSNCWRWLRETLDRRLALLRAK